MYDEMIDVPLHSVYTFKKIVGETASHWSQIPTKPTGRWAHLCWQRYAFGSGESHQCLAADGMMGWWDDDGQASLGIWGVKVLQPMGIEDPNLFHVPSPNAP